MKVYTYRTIDQPAEGSYQESGSKFLAYAHQVADRQAIETTLNDIRALHPRARHHCYAYRVLEREEITEYASDAGEPSGSAGQPILGELKRRELLNICVVVVRYFGGAKLGIPGLIHAYRESTARALSEANVVDEIRKSIFEMRMPLALQPVFYDACKHFAIGIDSPVYDTVFTALISVPMAHADELLGHVISRMAGTSGEIKQLMGHLGIVLTPVGND